MRRDLPSGTVTFLFTDVEGSTKLLHQMGADDYAEALAEHRRILREAFAHHSGVEVDTQGDALFAAFPTASGRSPQPRRRRRRSPQGRYPSVLACTPGEPTVTAEGYVGIDVHRGARIAAAGACSVQRFSRPLSPG